MLSIERCRQILGPGCQLSDDELERLREHLYALADITVAGFGHRGDDEIVMAGSEDFKEGICSERKE